MTDADDDLVSVARCLQGDASAFEPIVRRYERVMFAISLRLLGDFEEARDATQDAFVRAYEKLHTFDPSRKFFSWLYRIVVNECLNVRRARRPHEPLDAAYPTTSVAFEAVAAAELHSKVQAALGQLTREYREVIVLRHFADLSYDEISEVTGVELKTVKSRLFTARERLAKLLGAEMRALA